MKYLSLNTHSWIEQNALEKLKQTAEFIMKHDVEIIALQEVNQLIESLEVSVDSYFCSFSNSLRPIKSDNYAKLLVEYLKENGFNYYWSWTCSHIGYDIYEEGSAILSKYPFKAETVRVSPTTDILDYHTRQILLGVIDEANISLTVASCHFSWWSDNQEEGFSYEWHKLLSHLRETTNQVLLLGDFNTPAHLTNEGYQLITESFKDAYSLAKEKLGSYTVPDEIDGWEGNEEKLRIDFGFVSKDVDVLSYQVVFNGHNGPIVSDHFGIMIEF